MKQCKREGEEDDLKGTKGGTRILKSILIGAGISLAGMLVLCGIGAVLLSKEVIPEGAAGIMAWIICGFAALLGCWIAQKKAGSARLPVSLGCAGILLLVMGIVSTLGEDRGELRWYSAAIVAAAAIMAALLGAGKGTRRR